MAPGAYAFTVMPFFPSSFAEPHDIVTVIPEAGLPVTYQHSV